jgi:hypothetical protein
MEKFDKNLMALKWMERVDGIDIFPKLPYQLRKYHKQWERNCQVQSAVENMKSDIDILNDVNEKQMPSELGAAQDSVEDLDDFVMMGYDVDGSLPSVGLTSFQP